MPEIIFGQKSSYTWNFDHLDQDRLNNLRNNLEFCHMLKNIANRRRVTSNTGVPGIYWSGDSYRVRDRITKKHRGFANFEDAMLFNILNYVEATGDFEGALDFYGMNCTEEQKELLRHTLFLIHLQQTQELSEAS
jgi:hypothetical protein